jgi:hypothetical protein
MKKTKPDFFIELYRTPYHRVFTPVLDYKFVRRELNETVGKGFKTIAIFKIYLK